MYDKNDTDMDRNIVFQMKRHSIDGFCFCVKCRYIRNGCRTDRELELEEELERFKKELKLLKEELKLLKSNRVTNIIKE